MSCLTKRRMIPFWGYMLMLGLATGFWLGVWFSLAFHPELWGPSTSIFLKMAYFISIAPFSLGLWAGVGRIVSRRSSFP